MEKPTFMATTIGMVLLKTLVDAYRVERICVMSGFGGRYVEITRQSLHFFTNPEFVGCEYYDVTIVMGTMYIDPATAPL